MEQGLGSIEEQEGKSDQHSSGIQILNRMSFWKHLWCVYKKMLLCEYNLKIRRPPLWATVTWRDKFDFGFPDGTVGKQSACNTWDPGSIPGSGRSTGEGIGYPLQYSWASLVAQLVKNLPAMWETWVRSLGWEDLLEKGKATHSGILAWRIPWTI